MRLFLFSIAGLCCLMLAGQGWGAPPAARPAPAAPAPATPPPLEASPAADSFASAAAARHAKLTACLKDARARRLVGADKNAYVRDCVGH